MKLNRGNCNKPLYYIELYQQLLADKNPKRILEIGVQFGDSIRMWSSAFPEAEVLGLDIDIKGGIFGANVKIINGDQKDTALLQSLGRFDFIVDDGSHMTRDQQVTYEMLFPMLNEGGIYVIEDLEPDRQAEFKNSPKTTTEYFAAKLETTIVQSKETPKFIDEGISRITFANNLIVIHKI